MFSRDGFSRFRRKRQELLGVAERSNGLAFSHHHFLTASTSSSTSSHSCVLSQVDGNAPARPRERIIPCLQPGDENIKNDIIVPRQEVRSLIPPLSPVRTRTEPNTIRRRRNSSSSASVKSFSSSMLKRRTSIMARAPTLVAMPSELLDAIFWHLPQYDLYAIMLSNSNFIEIAVIYLYSSPQFASTYRFAQVCLPTPFLLLYFTPTPAPTPDYPRTYTNMTSVHRYHKTPPSLRTPGPHPGSLSFHRVPRQFLHRRNPLPCRLARIQIPARADVLRIRPKDLPRLLPKPPKPNLFPGQHSNTHSSTSFSHARKFPKNTRRAHRRNSPRPISLHASPKSKFLTLTTSI
jgi:hypothetical protein